MGNGTEDIKEASEDGSTLSELVAFAENKVISNLGGGFCDENLIAEAKACAKAKACSEPEACAEPKACTEPKACAKPKACDEQEGLPGPSPRPALQRPSDFSILMGTAMPILPMYVAGLVLATIEASASTYMLAITSTLVTDAQVKGMEHVKQGCLCLVVGCIFSTLCQNISSNLIGRASSRFSSSIQKQTMNALLRQDVAYFDKHAVGALQVRLSSDPARLSGN